MQIVPTLFGGDLPLQSIRLPEIPRAARLLRWIDRAIYLQVEESGRSPSLQRLDLDGNRLERLGGPWDEMRVRGFDVRPDGRQVLWSATPSGLQRDDLWVAALAGGAATPLTRPDDDSRKRFPLWNGPGTGVIYQSTAGGQVDLWELDVASRQLDRRTSDPGIERPESTSKNGSLSYQLTSQKTALWIWDARTGKGTQVSDEGLSDFAPSVSRDGQVVAFQRSLPSPIEGFLQMDSDIFIAALTAPWTRVAEPRKVGTGLAPQLSPDGKLLAYLQRAEGGQGLAQLLVRNVETTGLEKLSSTAVLPSGSNFPVDWTEQNVAWASPEDLYFVERGDPPETSRLAHYRVGTAPAPLTATQTSNRITDVYPSSDGRAIAYLTLRSTGEPEAEIYQLHVFNVDTGVARLVRDLGSAYLVLFRGWLQGDSGLLLARSLSFDADQTWTLELIVVSPDGTARQSGTIDRVVNVSRLVPRHSEVYFTRAVEGIGNLFAYSLSARKPRPVSESSVRDVTFGGIAALGADHVVGIRHEQTRDIHLLDARPRAGQRGQ
jgi:Tol biopolymer transport system component